MTSTPTTTQQGRRALTAAPGGVGAAEQLRYFALLWAMGLVFHHTDSTPLGMLPALAAVLPALLFPSSVVALVLLLGAGAALAVLHLPAASNHLVVSLLVTVALAGAAGCALRRPGGTAVSAARSPGGEVALWLDTARTPVGLTLLVVYGFTVLDKLNSAFFDPATSCAGRLLTQMVTINGGTAELPAPVVTIAAFGTVLVETAILVLLALPRTRRYGIALGVGFHAVLAPASFYDFATLVYAVYVVLVPREVFAALAPRAGARRRVALTAFAAHVVVAVAAGTVGAGGPPWPTLLVLTWYVAVGPLMLPLARACLTTRAEDDAAAGWQRWRWRPAVLLLVPTLALVNGTMPYLGVKTVASYSMFSNLRTEEGATNHVLPVLAAWQPAPYTRDTVTVTAVRMPDRASLSPLVIALGGVPYLHRAARWAGEPPPVRVPWLELRRTVLMWRDAGLRDVGLDYVHDGVERSVADATTDPELAAPMPWWQRQFLAFRAVDSGLGPDRCRW